MVGRIEDHGDAVLVWSAEAKQWVMEPKDKDGWEYVDHTTHYLQTRGCEQMCCFTTCPTMCFPLCPALWITLPSVCNARPYGSTWITLPTLCCKQFLCFSAYKRTRPRIKLVLHSLDLTYSHEQTNNRS
jgi:hypothetical protein